MRKPNSPERVCTYTKYMYLHGCRATPRSHWCHCQLEIMHTVSMQVTETNLVFLALPLEFFQISLNEYELEIQLIKNGFNVCPFNLSNRTTGKWWGLVLPGTDSQNNTNYNLFHAASKFTFSYFHNRPFVHIPKCVAFVPYFDSAAISADFWFYTVGHYGNSLE